MTLARLDINKKISDTFLFKAQELQAKGERYKFRALAYIRAARAISGLNEGLDEIYGRSWLTGLQKIKGVGNRLAHDIEKILLENSLIKKKIV